MPPGSGSTALPAGRMTAGTRSTLLGAFFLMATSAIGPGLITRMTTSTVQLGARRADLLGGWAAWLPTLHLAVNSIRPVIDLFS